MAISRPKSLFQLMDELNAADYVADCGATLIYVSANQ